MKMKIIAINGSPRKNWNTRSLLKKALEGAESVGAETELINLYELDYKGCVGCLGCKLKEGGNYGHCIKNDDLKSVLERIKNCDGIILGSPIYLGDITAALRAFWERFIFQYISYDNLGGSLFNGKLKTAFIYTMNASDDKVKQFKLNEVFNKYEQGLKRHFEYTGTVVSTETLQIDNYSKYHMAAANEEKRIQRRKTVFIDDCNKAYELGKAIASK